jgi:hypothetical protein
MESVIEVLKENELPPIAPVQLNDPMDYMRTPFDELKRLRNINGVDKLHEKPKPVYRLGPIRRLYISKHSVHLLVLVS